MLNRRNEKNVWLHWVEELNVFFYVWSIVYIKKKLT